MRIADRPALAPRPLQDRQSPARPFFNLGRSRIVVFLQAKQADVTRMRGGETGNLHVVAHHVLIVGERMCLAIEIELLLVPTGPPAQDTGDVQVFSNGLPPHVLWLNALFRTLVMATPSGMHAMVSAVPALARQMNPALQMQGH